MKLFYALRNARGPERVAIRNRIAEANLGLVIHLAGPRASGIYRMWDLVSAGQLALLRAIEKFDPDRGFQFSTYATRAILNAFAHFANVETRQRHRYRNGSKEIPDQEDCRPSKLSVKLDANRRSKAVFRLLDCLTQREREIVTYHFGLACEPLKLQEIGDLFGLTKSRISQIQKRAMQKLRDAAGSPITQENHNVQLHLRKVRCVQ